MTFDFIKLGWNRGTIDGEAEEEIKHEEEEAKRKK